MNIIKKDFDNRHNPESIFSTSIPLIISQLTKSGINYFSTLAISYFGYMKLAGLGLATTTVMVISFIFYGILTSVGVLISQSRGLEKFDEVRIIFKNGVTLALLLAIFNFIFIFFFYNIYIITDQNPQVIFNTKIYFKAYYISIVASILNTVYIQTLVACNKAYIVTKINLLRFLTVTLLLYLLVINNHIFKIIDPILYIGLCIAVGDWLVFTLLSLLILKYKIINITSLFNFEGVNIKYIWKMLTLGIPIAIIFFAEIGYYMANVLLAGHLSPQAQALYHSLSQCIMLIITIPYAISQATTVKSAYYLGKCDKESITKILISSLSLSYLLVLPTIIAIFTLSISILKPIFMYEGYENHISIAIIALISVIILIDSIRYILSGCLRGVKDVNYPMLINILSFWCIGLPLGYYFAIRLDYGIFGIFYGILLAILIASILLIIRYRQVMNNIKFLHLTSSLDSVKV
jgi:MATE family multidrug resistance protein